MGIFELKRQQPEPVDVSSAPAHVTRIDMQEDFNNQGFKLAQTMHGALNGLQVCLHRIYREHVEYVKTLNETQRDGNRATEERIEQLKGVIRSETLRSQRIKEEQIPECQENIERLEEDISDIRENPHKITENTPSRASFFIGLTILVFLSLYLFVFYTSASYSAFFKEFTEAEIAVSNSIFDAQALSKAYYAGVTELIFILLTPFIFLGLGFLIHKFQKGLGIAKYAKISTLILFTFLFDALLAFEITEKIERIKAIQAFESGFSYGVAESLMNPVFWLIIFAGFIVYIIWGFVFDFVMEEHEARDVVRNALAAKKDAIRRFREKISDYKSELHTLKGEIDEKEAEKQMLENRLARTTFVTKEFELKIDYFMEGWLQWTNANRRSDLNDDLIQYRNRFIAGLGTREDAVSAQEMRLAR